MRIIEVTFNSILKNLKKNIKLSLIVFILCIVIGCIVGVINAKAYGPREDIKKESVENLSLSEISQNESYYYNAFWSLKSKSDYLNAYLQYLEQVTLEEESRESLWKVQEQLSQYDDMLNSTILFFEENPITFNNMIEETISFYKEKNKILKSYQEEKRNKLDEVIKGNYTADYKASQQEKLCSDIERSDRNITVLNNIIQMLKDASYDEINYNTKKANETLAINYDKINEIIDAFNETMSEISDHESYEIIYNNRLLNEYEDEAGISNDIEKEDILVNQKDKAIIYAKSIEGLDIRKERFFATLTFFILFGLIVSVIIGAIYTPKKGNSVHE